MKQPLKLAVLGLCIATLPVGAELLPAQATTVDSLFFSLNASDPASYSTATPRQWNDLATPPQNGTVIGSSGLTYNSTTKALEFPGGSDSTNSNGYVDMGSGFSNFGTGLTIEFEGHFGAANQAWERVFDFGNGAEQDNIWVGVLGPYPDGTGGPLRDLPNRLAIEVWRDDLTPKYKPGICYTKNAELATNSFDKWVITLDGSTCRMYKNGIQVDVERWTAETPATTTAGSGVSYPFLPRVVQRTKNYIGKSNWGTDAAFNGAIKYVRIYTKALSSAEVTANNQTYTLTYATTGADSGTAPAAKTGNGLVSLDGNTGNMVKAGHAFLGWATTQGALTAISGSYNLTSSTTVHPVWVPVPSAPAISVSRASATSLGVAIGAPAINPGSVDGYRVETSTNGTSWTLVSDNVAAAATSYTITGLTTGSSYYVRVAAKYSGLLSPYGYNWQKIYEVVSPKRTAALGPIVYASGFGTTNGDAATTYASTNFTRVRYRMAATYGGSNNYVDADFSRSLGAKATYSETFDSLARLRVPTTSDGNPATSSEDHFEIQANVSDLNVESNMAGVQNGAGFDGRLEIWPWNYDPAATSGLTARAGATEYDDSDTPLMALSGQLSQSSYGSFQLHRLSSTAGEKRTVFAWNRHGDSARQEVGFGQYSGLHSDWTFAADVTAYQNETRTNFNLKIFIDMPVTLTANTFTVSYAAGVGGSGSAPTSPVSVADGSTFPTPANTFTQDGYSFAGWNDGTATYAAAATYPASGGVTSNVTLTAQWTANALSVAYDSQGGSAVASGTTVTGGSISVSPGTPTRAGYTFAGWFAASVGGTALAFPHVHGKTADFTLFAQWTASTPPDSSSTSSAPAVSPPDTAPSSSNTTPLSSQSDGTTTTSTTAPMTAASTAGGPRLTGPKKVRAGKTMSVIAEGFAPGEAVLMSLNGGGKPKRVVADAEGRVRLTVKLTSETRSGSVTVRAVGASAQVTQRIAVVGSSSKLPITGDSAAATMFFAFSAIFVGHMMLWRRRVNARWPM
jgi:uncharacterized repeat protein (TIGR02543 family)